MSSPRCEQCPQGNNGFILYIFKEDLEMIERWASVEPSSTDKQPTGGYLFGLWTNSLNPVVHIVCNDDVPAEDYLFIKSPHNENACFMFSSIGYWSFAKRTLERFQDARFVFLEVQVEHSRPATFHPVLLFKEQITHGKIEILRGKNPFRLPEELGNLTTQAENLREEKKGVVADLQHLLESGVTKVKSKMPDFRHTFGTTKESTVMQASHVEQSYQNKQPIKVHPVASAVSGMTQTRNTSFRSQYEREDVSTCTKRNQWYLTEKGQRDLLEISNKLEEVIKEKPKISRDNDTHNIMILFTFDNKSYVISFPPNFPQLNAELYPRQTRNNHSFAAPSRLNEKDPTRLVEEIFARSPCK